MWRDLTIKTLHTLIGTVNATDGTVANLGIFFYTRTPGQRATAPGDLARFRRNFPMPACYKKRGRVDPAARSQMDGRAPAGGLGDWVVVFQG